MDDYEDWTFESPIEIISLDDSQAIGDHKKEDLQKRGAIFL